MKSQGVGTAAANFKHFKVTLSPDSSHKKSVKLSSHRVGRLNCGLSRNSVGVAKVPTIDARDSLSTSTSKPYLSTCVVAAQSLIMAHWVSLENEALFFLHLFLTKEAKHLWYRKTVQSSLVSALISPISLPYLTQF